MANKQKNRAVVGVLAMVFVFFIVLMIFASYTVKLFKDESAIASAQSAKAQIGVIEIEGVIMDSKKVVELLHSAESNDSIKAIILRINSPGGAVGPTQEIYEEIRRIDSGFTKDEKKRAKNAKPIYASFGAIAASGGYYLGAGTRRIYSNAGAITGSIGVVMQFMDMSKLFEFAKVKPNPVTAGRYKDIGSTHRSMTEEERALLKGMMDDVHTQFKNHILETRKGKIKGDLNELAQGQIFSGSKAKEVGLVDRLGGLWSAGREIHKEMKLEGEFALKFIKKKKKPSIWEIVNSLDEAVTNVKNWGVSSPFLMFKM